MSNVISLAKAANPSIEDICNQFLADESKRLSPKIFRRYEEVIYLLQSHLNNYAHDGLSNAERILFERHSDAEGGAHRNYCQLFGPEKIFDQLGGFLGYFMIRKVMAGEELKRASGTVIKKFSRWLGDKGFVTKEAAAEAAEEGSSAAKVLPQAERASQILGEHAEHSGIYPNDFENDDDYIEFDHLTISKLATGKLWLEYHDIGESKILGPIAVPAAATKLLKEGWEISCGLGRTRGKWQIIEMGNIYPN